MTRPSARLSQAAREYERTTPRASTTRASVFHITLQPISRGLAISSTRISAAGMRNGPNTTGSLNNPCARSPAKTKVSCPGKATKSASRATAAEPIAASR